MARTNRSVYQEAEHTSQIPRAQRRLQRARQAGSMAVVTSMLAIGDAFSKGAISGAYNEQVLANMPIGEVRIPMDNITPSRLAVAGLYAAVGIISAVNANRSQSRVNHLETMAQGEAQADRLATATELASGQRDIEDVIPEPGEFPMRVRINPVEAGTPGIPTPSAAVEAPRPVPPIGPTSDTMNPGYGS